MENLVDIGTLTKNSQRNWLDACERKNIPDFWRDWYRKDD